MNRNCLSFFNALIVGLFVIITVRVSSAEQIEPGSVIKTSDGEIYLFPIQHATMVLTYKEHVIYVDPVGGADRFIKFPNPTLVLITDIHGDHLNAKTVKNTVKKKTKIVVPKAVSVKLPKELDSQIIALDNGETKKVDEISIEAIPMYNLTKERLEDRLALQKELDRLNRKLDAHPNFQAVDEFNQQAIHMILSGEARNALDLSKEDRRTFEAYDTKHFKAGFLKIQKSTLGHRLLLARRLCEAGCRFITVGSAGWDFHGNGKHPGMVEGMRLLGTPVDHAVSAFLDDVQQRGLSEKILLVITGEFGRTTRIQANGGRDHWPGLCPLVFAGGGLKMGQVIGQSEKSAEYPATEPIRLENLMSTMMHFMMDVGKLRVAQTVPKDLVNMIDHGKPIEALF